MKSVSPVWLVVALLLAAINLRPGITSLAPLIERIAGELSLSRGLIGLTTALPVLCMGLLAPVAPRLALRFGLERAITFCLLSIGIALLARLASNHAVVLIGSAVLVGSGIAVAGPLLSGFIKRYFLSRVGLVASWYSCGMGVGGAGAAVLSVPLTAAFQDDWRIALAAWALPAFVAAFVWWRMPSRAEEQPGAMALGLPWREPRAWLISGFFAIQAGMYYTMATWMVARYHEAGLSLVHANGVFSLFMLVGLPSAWLLPWLAQRFAIHQPLLVACALILAACLAMMTFLPTTLPEFWAGLMGLALSGSFSLALILPLYEVHTPIAVSRWTAMMLCAGYCMACAAPVLSGMVRDLSGSYELPFMVLTGLALVMSALAWMLRTRRNGLAD